MWHHRSWSSWNQIMGWGLFLYAFTQNDTELLQFIPLEHIKSLIINHPVIRSEFQIYALWKTFIKITLPKFWQCCWWPRGKHYLLYLLFMAYILLYCYTTTFVYGWLVVQSNAMVVPIDPMNIDFTGIGHCGFNFVLLFMFSVWEINVVSCYSNIMKKTHFLAEVHGLGKKENQ